jgi:hypothetical protein
MRVKRGAGREAGGRKGGTNLLSSIESDILLVEVLIQFEDRSDVPAAALPHSALAHPDEKVGTKG